MPTNRKTILQLLYALPQTQAAPVLRGEVLPEREPVRRSERMVLIRSILTYVVCLSGCAKVGGA